MMIDKKRITVVLLFLAATTLTTCNRKENLAGPLDWPAITKETKPWTRWWWPGSAVNEKDLTSLLTDYEAAGLGGMELTPTYGARGYEDQYIDYLSPRWMEVFRHTLSEASRLGLGVDMATGTGWNFGGPDVGEDQAAQRVIYRKYQLEGGQRLEEAVTCRQAPYITFVLNHAFELKQASPGDTVAPGPGGCGSVEVPLPGIGSIREPVSDNPNLQQLAIDQVIFEKEPEPFCVVAYSGDDNVIDLTGMVTGDGKLDWTAPGGEWTVYALFMGQTGKMVERAAPGGEGFMLNPFSGEALDDYLEKFDSAFRGTDLTGLRAFFNDSYEVDDARYWCNWSPNFLNEFEVRRDYRLQDHLPDLFGEEGARFPEAVLSDYRQTISELMLEHFTLPWQRWAAKKGKIIRNQAHGSPGNLLDLYAASDIPETEGQDVLQMKFASSAAHVTGKKLVSAESATWLNEDFTSTLSDLQTNLDNLFLGGVNHCVYHGTAYGPESEAWPGWFFYVAIHLNPRNPIWTDLPAFNAYVARVQSFLQSGQSDEDILVYFPVYDRYARREGYRSRRFDGDGPAGKLIERFNFRSRGWYGSSFRILADSLQKAGFATDFISDDQLAGATGRKGMIETGGNRYRVLVVPRCNYMPLGTFEKILKLARQGCKVVFQDSLPGEVPGLPDRDARQQEFNQMVKTLEFKEEGSLRTAKVGKGFMRMGSDVPGMLERSGAPPEPLTGMGLRYIRRSDRYGKIYFIKNDNPYGIDGWIPLLSDAASAAVFDPETGQSGLLATSQSEGKGVQVYLQLDPGQTCIIRAYKNPVAGPETAYLSPGADTVSVAGPWTVRFVEGGPELPSGTEIGELRSWTLFAEDGVDKFSGTAAYTTSFSKPSGSHEGWWLDLGGVAESARVILNGRQQRVLFHAPYRLYIPADSLRDENVLEVRVTNLAANRIADLDKRGVFWKKFYNNNLRASRREDVGPDGMFTAAGWEPRESGLIGPVVLVPGDRVRPGE